MTTALKQGDSRLPDVIAHHAREAGRARAKHLQLVKTAYWLARKAGVKVSRPELAKKTDNQLRIIIGNALEVVQDDK